MVVNPERELIHAWAIGETLIIVHAGQISTFIVFKIPNRHEVQ